MARTFSSSQLLRSPGLPVALGITLILAVQYGAAWYGLEMVKISKESEFNRHLADLGKLAEPQLRYTALEIIDLAETAETQAWRLARDAAPVTPDLTETTGLIARAAADSPEPAQAEGIETEPGIGEAATLYEASLDRILLEPFEEFLAQARLNDLALLDDAGRVLLTAASISRLNTQTDPGPRNADPEAIWPGENLLAGFEFLAIDEAQFESAMAGRAADALAYSTDAGPVKRVYVPIRDTRGETAAVLVMTAGRDYLGQLDVLARNLRVLLFFSTALVLAIGLMFSRLLGRQRIWERQAAHADRLTSLGTLAAGFAHEVRNPLEIISASTQDLERSFAEFDGPGAPPDAPETCRDILEEVDRLNRLVSQFLQYSRGGGAQTAPGGTASVGVSVTSAIAMLRHRAEKGGVKLDLLADGISDRTDGGRNGAASATAQGNLADQADRSDMATIDADSLRQIVVNLTLNAIEATPAGGRVVVAIEESEAEFSVVVTDTGPGIPAPERTRIFEPFYTTRSGGSGLGLSIAHQMAERSGGRLSLIESAPGPGACFALVVPRAPAVAGPPPLPAIASETPTARDTESIAQDLARAAREGG